MELKQVAEISQCLSNTVRLQILEWLKNPEANFPANTSGLSNKDGVCVTFINDKSGLSQSTISTYLKNMESCGLLKNKRIGKWTYFLRNEETIQAYTDYLK
ncbi:ArsR/SmtB family transcription factor [Rhizosphaericola mali]|uniref:Helix-turn-helix transcriptional regulator n=1 Tax=Rhizosphaericola mali TaxID=2545455 RepID=A0A5P2FXX1_9BACT|nr:helix-turn-helix transcriptional regulator [Rhizosphaericola mali]QES88336.1 helix-turn-helix transcriptional regulator [Rhizosphaericola mali]